jgi:hypothetical protein
MIAMLNDAGHCQSIGQYILEAGEARLRLDGEDGGSASDARVAVDPALEKL